MQKLLISSIALAFTLAMPLSALADSYDDFMRKGSAEFENPNNGKCKEKNINGGTDEEKSGYLEVAAKEKRILRKFGY
jgi:hypothetical protein